MRFSVILQSPTGEDITLATTRRYRGALNELEGHVISKRKQLMGKRGDGDRVVCGPMPTFNGELIAEGVIFMGPDAFAVYRFVIVRTGNNART